MNEDELYAQWQKEAETLHLDDPFLLLDYIHGHNLEKYIKQHRELSVENVVSVALQIISSLCYIHRQGLCHRDVKPSNILVEDMANSIPRAVLCDFGMAREDAPTSSTTIPANGSLAYISPESLSWGNQPANPDKELYRQERLQMYRGADAYGMGAVLFYMLTGEPPWGKNAEQIRKLLYTYMENTEPQKEQLRQANEQSLAGRLQGCDPYLQRACVQQLDFDTVRRPTVAWLFRRLHLWQLLRQMGLSTPEDWQKAAAALTVPDGLTLENLPPEWREAIGVIALQKAPLDWDGQKRGFGVLTDEERKTAQVFYVPGPDEQKGKLLAEVSPELRWCNVVLSPAQALVGLGCPNVASIPMPQDDDMSDWACYTRALHAIAERQWDKAVTGCRKLAQDAAKEWLRVLANQMASLLTFVQQTGAENDALQAELADCQKQLADQQTLRREIAERDKMLEETSLELAEVIGILQKLPKEL